MPGVLEGFYADVIQAERLREVRALVGFTRLDAPDPDDPDLVTRAPLSRSAARAGCPPARSAARALPAYARRSARRGGRPRVRRLAGAAGTPRGVRPLPEEPLLGPDHRAVRPDGQLAGERYLALHTLSHLLIRTIALECGYSSASLSERIYAGTDDDPRGGILIYTAVPDAEGTLGGLVSLGRAEDRWSGSPGGRWPTRTTAPPTRCAPNGCPQDPADFLHGAACHVCLFVSETTCERGNRFLDRRFVVPIDDADLALFPELP